MVDLSRLPRHLLERAAQLPENGNPGAQKALRSALKAKGATTPAVRKEPPQRASEDAGCTVRITLPLPPKELSPNARVHWSVERARARAARRRAYEAAKAALGVRSVVPPQWKTATAKIIFYWPDKRRRDADNALASCKAYLDGLANPTTSGPGAGVVADDSGLSFLPVEMKVDRENPRVEIEIERRP